jgi:hypothetical protein
MNEDYLWDKSGQPDPDIQQLEEILGTLRYQSKPLKMAVEMRVPRRKNYFPVLAIAATVLAALLAAGVWFQVRTSNKSEQQQANTITPVEKASPETATTPEPEKIIEKKSAPEGSKLAGHFKRRSRSTPRLTTRERQEALAAKEQLMLALRVASEKLNLAHRKTHSPQIKNQHRIG